MKIGDIMTKSVTLINLDTPLSEAANKMKAADIGALPVTDGVKIKGMLTDRDIVTRAIALGKDPTKTPASEAMTEKIRFVFDDQDISEAANSMKDRQIRRLIVLNRDKRLVGLVSFGDLCRQADDEHMFANVARCVSEPVAQHVAH